MYVSPILKMEMYSSKCYLELKFPCKLLLFLPCVVFDKIHTMALFYGKRNKERQKPSKKGVYYALTAYVYNHVDVITRCIYSTMQQFNL